MLKGVGVYIGRNEVIAVSAIRTTAATPASSVFRNRKRIKGVLPNLEQAVESFYGSESREAFAWPRCVGQPALTSAPARNGIPQVRSAVWAVLFLMFLGLAGPVAAAPAPKPVLAHYMPWYVAKPYSSSWGWHWTMNHYNPDNVGPDGRRAIAGWYYPAIGPYDSADPAVLEYHVLLMKLAGLDGVIVDWYGMDNYLDYGVNNQRTAALFNYTKKAGLKFCLCYEDATIQQEIKGSFIAAAGAAAHAQQTLRYAESNYFVAPSYLRWSNQPVFLNFGPQYFKASSDWQTIFSVLNPTNQPAFFPEDNRLAVGAGAFDWPPMWMSQANGGVLSATQLETYLSGFEQKALAPPAWPAC